MMMMMLNFKSIETQCRRNIIVFFTSSPHIVELIAEIKRKHELQRNVETEREEFSDLISEQTCRETAATIDIQDS
jgi:hypothetical protein